MNILQKAVTRLNKMVFGAQGWYAWDFPGTKIDYVRKVGDGLRSSVIMAPTLWVSRRMVESPIVLEHGDDPTITEHDMLSLLVRPNKYYSGRTMGKALTISVVTNGNGYLIKLRNKQLKPVELWYVPHWMMSPHGPLDGSEYIDYYEYMPRGEKIKLDPSDVIHIRDGIDPYNIRKGLSPLGSLLREVVTDDEAASYTAVMLQSSGTPSVIITPADEVTSIEDKEAEKIKAKFRELTGDRRGGAMVLSRKAQVEPLGWNPKELDLGSLRDIPEERVTAVLGIPAAVVGFGTGLQQTKVGATMMEMRAMAYEDCIIPLQFTYADEWKAQLLVDFEPDPDKWKVRYDNSGVKVLQEDQTRIVDRNVRAYKGGLITRAEGRANIDEEVDEVADDVFVMNMGETLVPRDQPPAPVDEGDDATSDDGDVSDDDLATDADGTPKWLKAYVKALPPKYGKLSYALMMDWLKWSEAWASKWRGWYRDLGAEAAIAAAEVLRDRGVETFAAKPALKITDDDILAALITERLDTTGLPYAPHFLNVTRQTLKTVKRVLGVGLNFPAGAQARIVAKGGIRKGLVDLSAQTKDAVFKALSQAREEGLGAAAAAERVASMVESGPWTSPDIRAMVVARTETKYAQNAGSIEVYRASDEVTGILVYDAQLGPTDEVCETLNGQVVSADEAEKLAESEHPNGTRSFAPLFEGMEAEHSRGAQNINVTLPPPPDIKLPEVNVTVTVPENGKSVQKRVKIVRDKDGVMMGAEIIEEGKHD